MLRCIHCGAEYKEEFNKNQCNSCVEKPNLTNLYSTSIKRYGCFATQKAEKVNDNLFLQREDKNPFSGTFKDRKTVFIANYEKIAVASSGNQAISLAKYNSFMNTFFRWIPLNQLYLYVSPHINQEKLKLLKEFYDEINFTDRILSIDELTQGESDRWNVSNGMDPVGASAYYQLAMELEDENFDYILVPCGSGELYTALSCYFHLLRQKSSPIIIPIQSK
jgi:hypothetical protein